MDTNKSSWTNSNLVIVMNGQEEVQIDWRAIADFNGTVESGLWNLKCLYQSLAVLRS